MNVHCQLHCTALTSFLPAPCLYHVLGLAQYRSKQIVASVQKRRNSVPARGHRRYYKHNDLTKATNYGSLKETLVAHRVSNKASLIRNVGCDIVPQKVGELRLSYGATEERPKTEERKTEGIEDADSPWKDVAALNGPIKDVYITDRSKLLRLGKRGFGKKADYIKPTKQRKVPVKESHSTVNSENSHDVLSWLESLGVRQKVRERFQAMRWEDVLGLRNKELLKKGIQSPVTRARLLAAFEVAKIHDREERMAHGSPRSFSQGSGETVVRRVSSLERGTGTGTAPSLTSRHTPRTKYRPQSMPHVLRELQSSTLNSLRSRRGFSQAVATTRGPCSRNPTDDHLGKPE